MKRDEYALLRSGAWINGFAPELTVGLVECEEKCYALNALPPSRKEERAEIIRSIFGHIGEKFTVHSPFHCDYGKHIHIGENFVGNYNLTMLDEADINIGDNVFIGPGCTLCTIIHALPYRARNSGIMRTAPIRIGNNVWIASNVSILPGVSIGDGAVIGSGSVVTKDIPANMLAFGNPCKVVRTINQDEEILPV